MAQKLTINTVFLLPKISSPKWSITIFFGLELSKYCHLKQTQSSSWIQFSGISSLFPTASVLKYLPQLSKVCESGHYCLSSDIHQLWAEASVPYWVQRIPWESLGQILISSGIEVSPFWVLKMNWEKQNCSSLLYSSWQIKSGCVEFINWFEFNW